MYKIYILVFLGITCNGDSTDNDRRKQGFYRPNYPQNQPQNSYSQNTRNTQPFGYQNTQTQGSNYNQSLSPQNALNPQKVQNAFGSGFNSFQNQNSFQNGFNQAQKPQNQKFANSNSQKQYQNGFYQAGSQTFNQNPQNPHFGFNSNSQFQITGSSFSQNTLKDPFSNYNQNSQNQNTFGSSFGQQKQPFASSFGQKQNAFSYENAGSNFGQSVFKGPEYLPPREPTLPPFTARTYLPPKEVPKTTTRRPFTTTRRPYTAPTYLPPEEIPKTTTRRPFTTTRRLYTTTYRPYTTTQRPYRFTTRHYNGTTLIPDYRTTTKRPFYLSTSSTTRKFYIIPTSTPLKMDIPRKFLPAMAMLVPPEPDDDPVRPNKTKIGTPDVSPAMAIPVPLEPEDDPTTTTTTTTTTPSTTTSSTTPSTTTTSTTPSTTTTSTTPSTTTSTTPSTTTSTTPSTTTSTTPSTTTSTTPSTTTSTTPSTTTSTTPSTTTSTTPSTTTTSTTPSTTTSTTPSTTTSTTPSTTTSTTPSTTTSTTTTPSTTTRLTPTTPDLNRFQEEETIPTTATTKRITTTTTPKPYKGPWYLPPEDDLTPSPTTPTTTSTTTTPRTSTTTPEPTVTTPENDRNLIEETTTTKKRCGPCRNRTTRKPTTTRNPLFPPPAPAMAMSVPPEPEEDPTPRPTTSTTTTPSTTTTSTTTTPSTTTSSTTPSTTTSTTTPSTTTTTTPSTTTSTTTTSTITTISTTTTPSTPTTSVYYVPPECDPADPTTYPSGVDARSSDPCGTTPTSRIPLQTVTPPHEDSTTPNRDRFLVEETTTPPTFRGPQYLPPEPPICIPEAKKRVARSAKTLELGDVTGARPVWHVGIYKKTTVPYMQICGGSVIRQDVVISAAHCFWSDFGPDVAENYAVGANKVYKPYGEAMDKRAQKSDVKQIILPPRYRGSLTSFQDDLALLRLAAPFTYARGLRPVCVDFDDDFDEQQLSVGNKGTVAGWGYTDSEGSRTQYLLWLELPYVDIETCIQRNEGFVKYITSDKVCAGEFDTGKALCKGDSGGGLVFWHGEPDNAVPYLRGIASTAPSADNLKCNVLAAGSFTRINAHRRFLRKHVPGIDKDCRYWDWD